MHHCIFHKFEQCQIVDENINIPAITSFCVEVFQSFGHVSCSLSKYDQQILRVQYRLFREHPGSKDLLYMSAIKYRICSFPVPSPLSDWSLTPRARILVFLLLPICKWVKSKVVLCWLDQHFYLLKVNTLCNHVDYLYLELHSVEFSFLQWTLF